jgi:SAM-dependent methyltransferase
MPNSSLRYSTEQCEATLADRTGLDWYHRFEVVTGSGVVTPGRLDVKGFQWRRDFVPLTPETVAGKRILDLGTYSGAFAFLLADLGADVVAVDVYDPDRNGFNVVNSLRTKQVEHRRMSVYDLDPEDIGTFDVVAFYGLHYHLRHPILALERINSVLKQDGLLIGGGTGMDYWFHDSDPSCLRGVNFEAVKKEVVGNDNILSVETVNDLPLCGYAPDQYLRAKSNWFIPNLAGLVAWVESCGFTVTKQYKNAPMNERDWNRNRDTDRRIRHTALNYVAVKTGEPTAEYAGPAIMTYRIPTPSEVERARNAAP